jgi:hypothetical protein
MRFNSASEFRSQPHHALTMFGMSGVGKTTIAYLLQKSGWFHYSVDYRIGTRYMDEHIVDNFKREAMKVPFLRGLLLSDSIYIHSNITFDNLAPLSTYLGNPGNESLGGIPFDEYKARQAQHRNAEIHSLNDVPDFITRARDIYQYQHFVCDTGGSLCEVVDVDNPDDPVLKALADNTLLLYVEGTPEHARTLVERFKLAPKPMYYQPDFLDRKWAEFKKLNNLSNDSEVNPDAFAVWGFEQLLHHRIPLYEKIAKNFGYRISMRDIAKLDSEQAVIDLICKTIEDQKK